jgi:hypothetical protein
VDVASYGEERRRECRELSLDDSGIVVAEEEGDPRRGRLLGVVHMNDFAFIKVHEIVVIEGEHIHREKYAYYLVVDGNEIGGYERDATHAHAEHRHCSIHGHGPGVPCGPISFKDAVREAWEWLSAHPR